MIKGNNNRILHKAKKEKKDEFYTRLCDIENELKHYKEHFKDKTVFLNCDNPYESDFWRYFEMNFEDLGLKKLISTHYDKEKPTYKLEMTKPGERVKTDLEQNGDFRNPECIELLKEANIVCTNPPFSLFREYVAQLIEYDKKFLIIGNQNAITYKEIFPLIRDNKMWLGHGFKGHVGFFRSPYEDTTKSTQHKDGLICVPGVVWFTNMDNKKRHECIIRDLYKNYTPEEFPKYDNYDAINVNKVSDIPCDYYGVMGVPITFLYKYNPDEFELVAFRKGNDGKDLVYTREREREFNRTFLSLYNEYCRNEKECRGEDQWEAYLCMYHKKKEAGEEIEPIDLAYPASMAISGCMNSSKDTMVQGKKKYARLLIQRKK